MTVTFRHEERVEVPVKTAFEFGLAPDNWPRHFSDLDDYDISEQTEAEMHVRLPYRILWFPMAFAITLRVREPTRHIQVDVGSNWLSGEANYRYSEIEKGTLIESTGTYDFGNSITVKLLSPLL